MTAEELAILQTPEVCRAIDENIGRDPIKVALDKRLPHASLVASQIKYLERARKKLPSYYEDRCIIPPLAFEQSSSESTAAHKEFCGERCIDMTCGLGIDTLALSKKFNEVISIERDPILAEAARINFDRLGAKNITVINDSSENFLASLVSNGKKADMLYVDPDRRSAEGKKLVRFEDCSPNIVELLPLMHKAADNIVVKASPLFDVAEAFRIFGNSCRVDVVSLNGECKEVVIECNNAIGEPTIKASVLGTGSAEFAWNAATPHLHNTPFEPPYRYMIIPDVALRKARITEPYFKSAIPEAFVTPGDGYVFTNDIPEDGKLLGRIFEIVSMDEYSPRALKRALKEKGVRSAEIYLHGFPKNTTVICRDLGIREGGGTKLAFTTIGTSLWTIELKTLPLLQQK